MNIFATYFVNEFIIFTVKLIILFNESFNSYTNCIKTLCEYQYQSRCEYLKVEKH